MIVGLYVVGGAENAGHENAAQNCRDEKCETWKMRETQNMESRKYRNAATYCVECEETCNGLLRNDV